MKSIRSSRARSGSPSYEADLAEWEGGTLTNLPQGSEYAPPASEGPQGDIFQEQQNMFGLVPQESAEARQEWDEARRRV